MGSSPEQENKILNSLLAKQDKTPAQVVQEFVALTSSISKDPSGNLGDHCYYTACAFRDLVRDTAPSNQGKLISFYNLLRKASITTPSGDPLIHEGDKVWQDMPAFGYTVADELASYSPYREYTAQSQRLENIVAFFAQLDATIDDSEPTMDFSRGWALQHTGYLSSDDREEGDEEEKTRELSIKIACLWYIYDADKMWRKVPEAEGYSLTQWQRRRDGLITTRSAQLSDETLKLVEEALSNILRVDGETWATKG